MAKGQEDSGKNEEKRIRNLEKGLLKSEEKFLKAIRKGKSKEEVKPILGEYLSSFGELANANDQKCIKYKKLYQATIELYSEFYNLNQK